MCEEGGGGGVCCALINDQGAVLGAAGAWNLLTGHSFEFEDDTNVGTTSAKKRAGESEGFVVKQDGRLATACPRVRVLDCGGGWSCVNFDGIFVWGAGCECEWWTFETFETCKLVVDLGDFVVEKG